MTQGSKIFSENVEELIAKLTHLYMRQPLIFEGI